MLEPLIREEAKKRQLAAQNNNAGRAVMQNSAQQESSKTRDEVAKIAGVSHDTIRKLQTVQALSDIPQAFYTVICR